MRRPLWSAALIALFAVAAASPAVAQKKTKSAYAPPEKVVELQKAIASYLASKAKPCVAKKLFAEGRELCQLALTFDPGCERASALLPKLAGETSARESTLKAWKRSREKIDKWLAKQREALTKLELDQARKGSVFRRVRGKVNAYLLRLPSGFTPRKQWPVLICVDGAGSNFAGCHRNFSGKASRYIVITPISFSNTNALSAAKYSCYPAELVSRLNTDHGGRTAFDVETVLGALDDLATDCNARKGWVFITGFSGGGNLTWKMVFAHPDKLAAASPACANFNTGLANPVSDAAARKALPVKAFQGDKDKYLTASTPGNNKGVDLNQQWEAASGLCKRHGYENVSREMLPGVGHSSCAGKVIAFFDGVLDALEAAEAGGKKKR